MGRRPRCSSVTYRLRYAPSNSSVRKAAESRAQPANFANATCMARFTINYERRYTRDFALWNRLPNAGHDSLALAYKSKRGRYANSG